MKVVALETSTTVDDNDMLVETNQYPIVEDENGRAVSVITLGLEYAESEGFDTNTVSWQTPYDW